MIPAILVFLKHPTPGRVKTRLAAQVGAEQAAAIYKTLAETVCARLPSDARIFIAFEPAEKAAEIEAWISPVLSRRADFGAVEKGDRQPAITFFPQSQGDLGARMALAFDAVFATGCAKAAVIGSDCIELEAATFASAWRALDEHDGVLGPAADGGYYLLALRRPCAGLFENIAWSSDRTLRETLDRARELGLSIFLLPVQNDVDTERDWRRARARLG